MIERPLLSVDIGSTYTKGALFSLENGDLRMVARAECPTTVEDLGLGFQRVRAAAVSGLKSGESTSVPVYLSSSARGGLKIAALGLTRDLTLSVAKMAAASAGGKIVRAYSYELTAGDTADLEGLSPDIILFTGGTDGGNTRIVLHNAEQLAACPLQSVILFAGNGKIKDRVLHILRNKDVVIAENVMPDVGTVNIEPAREVIRRIFLDRIVDGKGLTAVVREIGRDPLPTPLAVFELARRIGEGIPGWDNFALIDMGGATTDFYSFTEAFHGGGSVILRGLPEPLLKRTVEGDLGMRVSAEALLQSEKSFLEARLRQAGRDIEAFHRYVRDVAGHTEYRPAGEIEGYYDDLMAAACIRASALRHAGVISRVFTAGGEVEVQKGKDLRRIDRLIGSGGYLSRLRQPDLLLEACAPALAESEARPLLPESPVAYADGDNRMPLLGNLAPDYPDAAARAAVAGLRRLADRP